MNSIDDKIMAKMTRQKAGHIFIFNDFANLGTANAVRVALHRLVKKGVIQRIIPGLFVLPQTSKLLNKEVLPNIESIAQAIARRDNATIIPTGAYALNALGLSTQVPLNIVYLTNGKDRKIKIGEAFIRFKKASLKKLALKGKISQLAILAMIEIGKDKLTPVEINKIINLLKKENIDDLKHDMTLAPQWVAEIINNGLKK
jgi:predicted transcriptional regulator of viral defense system